MTIGYGISTQDNLPLRYITFLNFGIFLLISRFIRYNITGNTQPVRYPKNCTLSINTCYKIKYATVFNELKLARVPKLEKLDT